MGTIHRELKITVTPVPVPSKWVFVVGCYNSGTTLLSEVLASHEKIGYLPTEGHFLTDQFPSEYDIGISRMWMLREDLYRLHENDTGPDIIRLKKEWGMRMSDTSKDVLLEKSPQNGARTRWLQKHFNNSHFICMIRNGYAVAEGISRKAKPECQIGKWPIHMSAQQWCLSNRVFREDSKYLDKFIWVRYEDFTADPNRELDKIFNFIGLSVAGDINLERQWSIHERQDSIKNMNNESIARLKLSEINDINRVAGDCLTEFGYDVLSDVSK